MKYIEQCLFGAFAGTAPFHGEIVRFESEPYYTMLYDKGFCQQDETCVSAGWQDFEWLIVDDLIVCNQYGVQPEGAKFANEMNSMLHQFRAKVRKVVIP